MLEKRENEEESGCMENSQGENNGAFPNKYEIAIIAAREARRLNDVLRRANEEGEEKVTLKAIQKVGKGGVRYTYEEDERRME
jgi:DNA-directed RNA polymerase subunit K/omega